ncbi:MAG: hypothetical protein N3C61_01380 [Candidatus Micrarchaeota archaeon]|nr:hypothetical protein [Candidatus Micrarchaeota archaeon]
MVDLTSIYIIILAILSYYDIRNNKHVPDLLVFLMYCIGIYESILRDLLVLFLSVSGLLYLIHRLGLFGDAEVFVIPPLLIHFGIEAIDMFIVAIVLAVAASYNLIFMIFVSLVMIFNPVLSMVLSYVGFLVWRDKIRIVERKIVSPELIGEITVDGKIISRDFVIENMGKDIEIKRSIPFLPFLLIGSLLVIYTEISFLRQLLLLA